MATVYRLPVQPVHQPVEPVAESESLLTRLAQLVQLLLELGIAEARGLLLSAAIAVGVAITGIIALIASVVVLLAGAVSPLFGARWEPLILAGGVVLVLALAGIGWSVWRVTSLDWPRQTVTSLQENWRWLAAQLRSKLTLR